MPANQYGEENVQSEISLQVLSPLPVTFNGLGYLTSGPENGDLLALH